MSAMMDVLLSSQGDNSRDRALGDMMGGAIQVKKEDILKKVGLQGRNIPSIIGIMMLFYFSSLMLLCDYVKIMFQKSCKHLRKQIEKTIDLHFPSEQTQQHSSRPTKSQQWPLD